MPSDVRRYLGVDGGGTRTTFCLITDAGDVLARSEQPTTSYFQAEDGIAHVSRVLEQGVAAVTDDPGAIDHAFFALPSYGEASGDVPKLDAAPRPILGHDRYACDNDMVAGWAGSLAGRDGINVVCGTGSIAYGEHDGRRARAGGWGELFGDEASAYWIAVRVLNAFTRMSDGREPRTPLHDLVMRALELEADLDVIDVVLGRWQGDRGRVASLAPITVAAAERGDATAAAILREAGEELAALVAAVVRKAGFPEGEPIPVSYSGGVFGAGAHVLEPFEHALPAGCDLRSPLLPPEIGAALYAARLDGRPFDDPAVQRLASRVGGDA
jgi:N-acetylglucosamine kinase-like BadF-type ATPase